MLLIKSVTNNTDLMLSLGSEIYKVEALCRQDAQKINTFEIQLNFSLQIFMILSDLSQADITILSHQNSSSLSSKGR